MKTLARIGWEMLDAAAAGIGDPVVVGKVSAVELAAAAVRVIGQFRCPLCGEDAGSGDACRFCRLVHALDSWDDIGGVRSLESVMFGEEKRR